MEQRAPGTMISNLRLRDVTEADLPIFFEHQLDPDAARMAAFPSRDWGSFMAHWTKILADDTIITQTILVDGQVAGNIVSWEQLGERDVGYWLGKLFWGQGIATRALAAFLGQVRTRPLYGSRCRESSLAALLSYHLYLTHPVHRASSHTDHRDR